MKKLMMTVAGVLMVGAAVAATATTFAYQGVLRDEYGRAINANTATIEFRLYEGVDADTAVWGRKMTLSIDTNGLFNAELSDNGGTAISGISETLEAGVASTLENVIAHAEKNGKSVYVGLTVKDSSGEIRPRQKLLPVPMAGYAQNVTEAKGDLKVGGDLQVSGAIGIENGTFTANDIDVQKATFSGAVQMENGATIGGSDTGASATNLTVNGQMVAKGNILLGNGSRILMNGKYDATIPIGTIILWSGNPLYLPEGWVICAPRKDGTPIRYRNPYDTISEEPCTVPDLRGRFVVGANYDSDGSLQKNPDFSEYRMNRTTSRKSDETSDRSGEEMHQLTVDEMPSHTHDYYYDTYARRLLTDGDSYDYMFHGGSGNHATTKSAGKDKSHENRPPFYALCYIIFVGDNLVTE